MENLKFEEMNLSYDIVRAVKDMGFEEATPIQSQAISVIMEGKDIIGQSQTGTGKTAAFGLPCLEMLDPDNKGLQALILCPMPFSFAPFSIFLCMVIKIITLSSHKGLYIALKLCNIKAPILGAYYF